eukprot:11201253-Lingulodinium_polyedra.AAC.1
MRQPFPAFTIRSAIWMLGHCWGVLCVPHVWGSDLMFLRGRFFGGAAPGAGLGFVRVATNTIDSRDRPCS